MGLLRLRDLHSAQKWSIIGLIIGVVVGVTSLVIYYGIYLFETIFLGGIDGYNRPLPLGEGGTLSYVFSMHSYVLLPLVMILGALVSGILVYRFAPETEGHGTDAVINAFHNEDGRIRERVPLVKLLSSMFLIGSGGSGGREGPTAQVSAGIGNAIARRLDITKGDKRIMTAIAMGAGIGTIFKAPFGGALLSGEILYKHDIEVETIFPCVIASIVGFTIFGAFVGYSPIFGSGSGLTNYFFDPIRLPFILIVGLFTGLFARLYVKVFYFVHNAFARLRVKKFIKPAIGAAFTGLIALAFPEVIGVSYGWVQFMISGSVHQFVNVFGLPVVVFFFVLALMKIFATSTSVASGGSAGVFAPGMFIGASVGTMVALILNSVFPTIITPSLIGVFAIIGMLSFFGAAGNVPIAVTVMVIEMTGSLALLPAAMFSVAIARIVSGNDSIYRSQVDTRRDSAAHISEYYNPLARKIKVRSLIIRQRSISQYEPIYAADAYMKKNGLMSAPVVDGRGMFLGAIYLDDLQAETMQARRNVSRAIRRVRHVSLGATAEEAWHAMVKNRASWCAVLDGDRYIGVVKMRSIFRKYAY